MGTVDDLLAGLDPDDRASMERIYAVARDEVPEAEQGLGYGMPALVYRGKPLVSVMRAKKHIGIYPFSPAAVSAVADRSRGIRGSASTRGRSAISRSIRCPTTSCARWCSPARSRSRDDAAAASVGEHQADADRDHHDGDDRVEDPPRARGREPATEVARAEREAEEPDEARDARLRRRTPSARRRACSRRSRAGRPCRGTRAGSAR